jgi:protease-4
MPAGPLFDADNPSRGAAPTVIVQTQSSGWRGWALWAALIVLGFSLMTNLGMFAAYSDYFANTEPPIERFHSGDTSASDKIVVLNVNGTIMPPFTERLIKQIEEAEKTDRVKGVLLVVDSPGGFVADSHEIYHRLKKLSDKKPVFVQMKRMAASGGYYIAMGAGPQGKIFAEPTTWTGSIGVIIPRYDVSKLAEKFGVDSAPLKTGEFKDALNPFRPISEPERKVWENILNQAFEQFIEVIDTNRDPLTAEKVKELATGQIYTAKDAQANGMIDGIGYEDEALEKLKEHLGLPKARVVTYEHPLTLVDVLLGSAKADATASAHPLRSFLESSVPQALYYCSWLPPLPQ